MNNKFLLHKLLIILISLISGLGVLLNVAQDDWSLSGLAYFTNMSNILVFLVYGYLFFNQKPLNSLKRIILYQTVLSIVMTGLVYHLVLSPNFDGSSLVNPLPNIMVHTLSPLLVIIERLIFSQRKALNRIYPLYWLAFPLIYYLFTLIYARFGGVFASGTEYESSYPYFFLNVKEYGPIYFIIVILFFILVGYLLVFINHHPIPIKNESKSRV